MIDYRDTAAGIRPEQLDGFFEGWPAPPSPQDHLRILEQSSHVLLAVDRGSGQVVGFITAVSDGVLAAYIPLLEVLPGWRGRGIGTELARRMLKRLKGFYAVDLLCDPGFQSFYARLGMRPACGMMIRRPSRMS